MKGQNNKRTMLKAGIWYTFSSFLLKVVAFLTPPVFVRLLSPVEYGEYSNFLSWLSILSIITTLSMSSTLNRARFDFKEKYHEYISSILALSTLCVVFCYGIAVLRMDYFSEFFSMSPFYIHILFLSLLFSSAIDIFQIDQRIQYRYKPSVLIGFASILATILVSLALVLGCPDKLFGRVVGSQLPLFIVNFVIYIYFLEKVSGFAGNTGNMHWSSACHIFRTCLREIFWEPWTG